MKCSSTYDPDRNRHTYQGARDALRLVLKEYPVSSILDVGCGPMMWGRAALDLGIEDYIGVDGLTPDSHLDDDLRSRYRQHDLTKPLVMDRRFDLALCLEVAEHLPEAASSTLLDSLSNQADLIVFSAAVPGQMGQDHIHCRWPDYWQGKLNALGYCCSDELRWNLWREGTVEPWYRQNIFIATRDARRAGNEERIAPVIHPDMLDFVEASNRVVSPTATAVIQRQIASGSMPLSWYLRILPVAFMKKLSRRLS